MPAGAGADSIDPNAKLVSTWTSSSSASSSRLVANIDVGVRYIHRNIGRVLEDVATYAGRGLDLGVPGVGGGRLHADQSRTEHAALSVAQPWRGASSDPMHNYNAVEFTVEPPVLEQLVAHGSYRWSRLHGTFEGFYRDDNGQSDPGITSLYDFPTNDPSYTAIGVPSSAIGRHPVPRRPGRRAAAAGPDARRQGVWHIPV